MGRDREGFRKALGGGCAGSRKYRAAEFLDGFLATDPDGRVRRHAPGEWALYRVRRVSENAYSDEAPEFFPSRSALEIRLAAMGLRLGRPPKANDPSVRTVWRMWSVKEVSNWR